MPEVDMDERKLQYLNRSASAADDKAQAAIDEEYPDVVNMLLGNQPAKGPALPPSTQETPLTLASLIGAFGAKDVAQAALERLTDAEYDALFPDAVVAAGQSVMAIEVVLANLPLLTADELNQTLDALGPLIDAGGASAPVSAPAELAPGFPAAWRELQWKAKVKLANSLGGQAANAAEADTFLAAKEAAIKGGA